MDFVQTAQWRRRLCLTIAVVGFAAIKLHGNLAAPAAGPAQVATSDAKHAHGSSNGHAAPGRSTVFTLPQRVVSSAYAGLLRIATSRNSLH